MPSPPAPRRRSLRAGAVVVGAAWLSRPRATVAAEADSVDAEAAIAAVLAAQAEAWNGGDIERFLEPYWKSDSLTFASGGEMRRGFAATRARYLKTYPDRQAMGRLSFADLETTPLGPDAALVLGTWRLDRDAGPIGGNFTLVFRRIDGAWTIVHDHTSRRPDAP